MFLSPTQTKLITRVVNVFETGTADGDYAALVVFADGPHQVRQITYGRSQTTEYGHLRTLVQSYVGAGGTHSSALAPYVDRIGSQPLVDDATFKSLLVHAGADPVMRQVQDVFFDRTYFEPARAWAEAEGFTLPLSMLVIYDSFIHSGRILWAIRNTFAESPPSAGGDERAWITAYVRARHHWLAHHEREILHATVYRTVALASEIERGNWHLAEQPIRAHGVDVTA